LINFDKDSTYIDLKRVILKGVNQKSKAEFIIRNLDFSQPIQAGDYRFLGFDKAVKTDKLVYRTSTVSQYPNLLLSDLNFENPIQITNVNPQQKDYNWATVEQIKWTSYKGLELDGLFYKPEDFDSTKHYPMIVYFYEKYDDRLHNHYSPRPTASIVFPTEYASNGYIVFIPNILYTPGHPAQSAYDCIVSGTDYLTDKYNWIDTSKLALQGQSWGGYQTAQLVTMTNKYTCGMAGAPVSNMFSAYGGIRWGSGLSRQFQYERTQSRIGCTIWDCPELYIENSPIFGLPRVNTPLLIMHNDNDGAVPWYQGIEMFMGLRRLEKPVWLLNYNGDAHNLMKNANREDLSLRMRQFFDYYLKDEPMPLWMKNGVPAIEKGNPSNLELETTK
jgi:dipeptidyl aminopeptidase/acylaminoacyl peptidase